MEFCKLAHEIWQNFPQKNVGPTDHHRSAKMTLTTLNANPNLNPNANQLCPNSNPTPNPNPDSN